MATFPILALTITTRSRGSSSMSTPFTPLPTSIVLKVIKVSSTTNGTSPTPSGETAPGLKPSTLTSSPDVANWHPEFGRVVTQPGSRADLRLGHPRVLNSADDFCGRSVPKLQGFVSTRTRREHHGAVRGERC